MNFINRMFAALLSLALFGLALTCCNQSSPAAFQERDGIANPAARQALLEVSTAASSTVYPPGETLDLRLYENGEAEFDYYLPPNPNRVGEPFKPVRRHAKLSAEEVGRIKTLLAGPDLSSAKAEYLPTQGMIDSYTVKTITYNDAGRERRIVLRENDSHLLLDKKEGVYPESLIELLKLIQNINDSLRNRAT
jgi:hypothetical protein